MEDVRDLAPHLHHNYPYPNHLRSTHNSQLATDNCGEAAW